MVTIGTDLEDSVRCVELANAHAQVFAAVGVHPCSVHEIEATDWLDQIRRLATDPKVAAIGEIGLDYFHPAPDGWTEERYHARQAEFFTAQLELAAETGLNIVVHQRDRGDRCWEDIQRLVAPFHGKLRAVFHCFTHSWEAAQPLVEQGHLISFTGITTFNSAKEMQACATAATVGSFMLETDAPYLAPAPHRGKRCEPAFTSHTAEFIAKLRGVSLAQLAEETEHTANAFFRF
jgi:TatD DNase family protein